MWDYIHLFKVDPILLISSTGFVKKHIQKCNQGQEPLTKLLFWCSPDHVTLLESHEFDYPPRQEIITNLIDKL